MDQPDLTVAILTFRRPDQLMSNLDAVERGIDEASELVRARILIVDNDPQASARMAVLGRAADRVMYVHEPRPGIAAARNRALDESSASRYLVFIDDDEVPQAGWLTSLVTTRARFDADAVSGRVVSVMPEGADPRIIAGGFFDRPSRPTGTVMSAAATGNLLLDLGAVRRTGVRFDERLGLGGGEDTVFTSTFARAGARIVWCDESVAIDHVQPDRTTWQWMRRRAFAHGNVLQRTRQMLAGSTAETIRIRAGGVLGGLARIARGALQWAWGAVAGDLRHRARGDRGVQRGAGVLAASIGVNHLEYRRETGAPT